MTYRFSFMVNDGLTRTESYIEEGTGDAEVQERIEEELARRYPRDLVTLLEIENTETNTRVYANRAYLDA